MDVEDQKLAQINVRVSQALANRIDAKRIALQQELGVIPSRSEVIRLAIEEFVKDISGTTDSSID